MCEKSASSLTLQTSRVYFGSESLLYLTCFVSSEITLYLNCLVGFLVRVQNDNSITLLGPKHIQTYSIDDDHNFIRVSFLTSFEYHSCCCSSHSKCSYKTTRVNCKTVIQDSNMKISCSVLLDASNLSLRKQLSFLTYIIVLNVMIAGRSILTLCCKFCSVSFVKVWEKYIILL